MAITVFHVTYDLLSAIAQKFLTTNREIGAPPDRKPTVLP
jgi:hypothetical protein